MASDTVGDFVVERLHAWGVRRIYGLPGDGINGIVGALDRAQDRVEFIQTRHEELAAFMACAHAKFTGEVGVCLATAGPGAIHLLNGLYDAKGDHQPVVALVGQQARTALGSDYQQEVDLLALFKDVAHAYVQMATTPEQVRHLVDRAMRVARDKRTVTAIVFPSDVQELPAAAPGRAHGMTRSGIGATRSALAPPPAELARAAEILNAGERVAVLVGAGALAATDEVLAVADRLGAGIAKALLGKAVVPDDLPHVTGSLGLLGTEPSWRMMEGCDTLLMVGAGFPYAEYLPEDGKARGVQIDIDPAMLSLRYPMELNLVGDAKATLAGLLPLLQPKADRAWRDGIERDVATWWRVLEARAMVDADPINPQRVFWELSPRLPDDCIVCGDVGSTTYFYARDVKLRRGMMSSLSGGLASMGSALPYAVAAKFAHPQRCVLAIAGDGAMQMSGINGLIEVAKYWKRWADPRLVVMVLNNRDLNFVTWEQRVTEGNPKFSGSQDLPDFAYADYARLLGLDGVRVERPEDVGPAWERAFAADRPFLVEMVADPNVPPVPPHVTPGQVGSYAKALLKGDPDAIAAIKATAKDWWAGLGKR